MESVDPLGEHALHYADEYGYEVFPLIPTGELAKTPLTTHGMLDASTDLDRIRVWWDRHPDALIGHRIDPTVLVLDVDPRHGGMDVYRALADEFGITPGRVHISGRGDGGGHLHFWRPPGRLSMTRVAEWARERGLGQAKGERWITGIDLLHHDHRYTVLPPSPHPDTRMPYFWRGNGPEDPPGVLPEALVALLQAPPEVEKPPPGPHDPDSIADWFSATQGFSWLTDDGWSLTRGNGTSDGSAWRHPEATHAVSATVRNGCLFVYSENTPFEVTMPGDPAGYTPFSAWAVLHHGGDQHVAAGAARTIKRAEDGQKLEALLAAALVSGEEPPDLVPETPESPPPSTNGSAPVKQWDPVWMNRVRIRHIDWLWHPFLPLGKLVIHAGEPGMMKSSLDVAVAAEITNGTGFARRFGPRNVVFLNYEDDDEDGLGPRLIAAGADLSRCASVPNDAGPIGLAQIVRKADPIAVFVDPFGSWAEAAENTGLETQVRQALLPLRHLAYLTGALVKVNCHPNKQNSLSDALYRISGSLGGMVGFARVVLASRREGGKHTAGIVKSNVGPDEVGIEYFAKSTPVTIDEETAEYPRVLFGSVVSIERKNFFAAEDQEQTPMKAQQCAEEIREILKDGPRVTSEVKGLLAAKYGQHTIQAARNIAGVVTRGQGNGARWVLEGGCQGERARVSTDVESEVDLTESEHRDTRALPPTPPPPSDAAPPVEWERGTP